MGEQLFLPIGLTIEKEDSTNKLHFKLKIRKNVWIFPITEEDGDLRRAYDEAISMKEKVSKTPL